MKNIISTVKSKGTKLMAAATAVMLLPMGVFADGPAQWTGGTDINSLMGGLIGMMLSIAKYAGMGLTVWGIIKTVMAYKDDNTNEITQGIRLAVVGIFLIGLRSILNALGLVG